jgi:16S rRNA (guanine966-N2)-methyltransferase
MRVIAGSAGGIQLKVPGHDLRPTMDLVRGAIFSSLGDAVIGSNVLDLFAGSGAFGIEALSRGAAAALFVDTDPRAVTAIRANLAKTRLSGEVRRADALQLLNRLAPGFDLIFADPPYAKRKTDRDFVTDLLTHPRLPTLLAPDGLLILERAPAPAAQLPEPWEPTKSRSYGATEVLFLRKENDRQGSTTIDKGQNYNP